MKTVNEYVDACLNLISAEKLLREELIERIGIKDENIKNIRLKTYPEDTKMVQIVIIELIGQNSICSEDIKDIKGFYIVTPNIIEIVVSEIDL